MAFRTPFPFSTSVANLSDISHTATTIGFTDATRAGQPGLRMHISDMVIVVTFVMQAAAADLTILSAVTDVRDDVDFNQMISFDVPLAAANGATAFMALAVPVVQTKDGVVFPPDAGLRIGMTLSLRSGTAAQMMRAHINATWLNRFVV